MDLTDYKPKVDHFENINCLQEGKVDGAPNFRQVTGTGLYQLRESCSSYLLKIRDFPVFGCAQPTEDGFKKVLDQIPKGSDEQQMKIIWFNMRQEPVVYINGNPCAPRHPERLHDNIQVRYNIY